MYASSENVGCIPLAVVIMTTANGMHQKFSGRHKQLFIISDLYLVLILNKGIACNVLLICACTTVLHPCTIPQPQRNVLKYFAILKNVAHSLEPGETPSYSASHQAPNYVQHS